TADPDGPAPHATAVRREGVPRTGMDWAIDPTGIETLLLRLTHEYGARRLYVTENGSAFPDTVRPDGTVDDPERRAYLEDHIAACASAARKGAPLAGYFAWSLLDNFEWAYGYDKRFGLVHVDYATQTRTIKGSGHRYAEIIRPHRGRDTRAACPRCGPSADHASAEGDPRVPRLPRARPRAVPPAQEVRTVHTDDPALLGVLECGAGEVAGRHHDGHVRPVHGETRAAEPLHVLGTDPVRVAVPLALHNKETPVRGPRDHIGTQVPGPAHDLDVTTPVPAAQSGHRLLELVGIQGFVGRVQRVHRRVDEDGGLFGPQQAPLGRHSPRTGTTRGGGARRGDRRGGQGGLAGAGRAG